MRDAEPSDPRVLVLAEQLQRRVPGGIGRYIEGLIHGLDALTGSDEADVTVFSARSMPGRRIPDDADDRTGPHRSVRGAERSRLLGRLPEPVLTRGWDWGIAGVPTGFDVVHAASLAAPARSRRRRRSGTPLAVTVADLAWRHHPDATTRRGAQWHEAAWGRANRYADAFVVPSSAVGAEVHAEVGDRPVAVIPHGSDHLAAPDIPGAQGVLTSHRIHGPFLLAVGTLEPRKNLKRLIAAYHIAQPSLPEPWPLVIVGPTGWGSTEPALSGETPEPSGVVAMGPVTPPVLSGLYHLARLLAYVPLYEGYGFPPVEAFRIGTPVVASTTVPTAHGDSDGPGDAGDAAGPPALGVDPTDAEAISQALVTAATDEDLRRRLVIRGKALSESQTWARSARSHVALWRQIHG